ncbi:transposase family protein [Streptomyces sp. NPDC127069]|uniref:helix-turn-helix domain-containing protein n=1 Tax=Streptomyces sp. NPDC127069 TaxID=3347128 RepID=UPI003659932C
MLEDLAPKWEVARESALRERRGGDRRRAAGAGPKQRLVFTDQLLITLVHLRLGLRHAALAQLYGVDRSTVSGAIGEVRPMLAARGFAVPDRPGPRLCTLEDLFAYADAETAVRTEAIAEQFRQHPKVKAEVDEGYRGLANEFPAQVSAPPKKPQDDGPLGEHRAWREQRRRQSSRRIRMEHANAEYKQWRPLQRFTCRRETYAECSPGSPPADHPPADPPGQHTPISIAPKVVNVRGTARFADRRMMPDKVRVTRAVGKTSWPR